MSKNKHTHLQRTFTTSVRAISGPKSARPVYRLPISSEAGVLRSGGPAPIWVEVLSHEPGAIDFSRADGMPLLLEHELSDQVGAVTKLELVDGRLEAEIRFSASARGAEIEQDVADGIRRNVSIGYVVYELEAAGVDANGVPIFRATKWMPYETSIVSVPADTSVGVGRAEVVPPAAASDEDEDEKDDANEQAPAVVPVVVDGAQAADAPQEPSEPQEPVDATTASSGKPADDAAQAPQATEPAKAPEAEAPETEPAPTQAAPEADKPQADQKETPAAPPAEAHAPAAASATAEVSKETANSAPNQASGAAIPDDETEKKKRAAALLASRRSTPLNNSTFTQVRTTNMSRPTYSIARAIQLQIGEASGGYEAEMHQELSRRLPQGYAPRGGILIPMDTRAMTTTAAGAGAELANPAATGEMIDLLRNKAVVLQLGARLMSDLNGPITFPKIVGGAKATWGVENPGVDTPETQLATGQVGLSAKTLQSTTSFSRQLLKQSAVNIETLVRAELTDAHALALDYAALHGAGGHEPLGLYNAPGVNVVDVKSGAVTYADLVAAVAKVLTKNALLGSTGFVAHPLLAAKLATTLVAQTAGAGFLWDGKLDDGTVAGYAALASNQLRADLGANRDELGLVFGNFADVMIGSWGAVELIVDELSLKKQGVIEVTSFQMADVALRNGESFTKFVGIKQ